MKRSPGRWAFAVLMAACGLWPGTSRADIREVAARVKQQWKVAGASTAALPSRFLFDDETIAIPIPEDYASCVRVALIGPRGMSFHAKLSDAGFDPLAPDAGARATAVAGVLELHRCDARRVRHVLVTSDAGRGAIEIVVASAETGLPSLGAVIPERTGGPLPPIPEAGSLPALPPVDKRAEAAETRAKRDGATVMGRTSTRATDDSSGSAEVVVEPGCHRIEVFGRDPRTDQPTRRFRLDLDAELRDAEEEKVVARDRTEAPDARMETCVGKRTTLDVAFAGALPGSEVVMTLASWPIPARLPPLWGPAARSRMARAMLTRHVAVPAENPVFIAQGGSGTTPFPIEVETGGCYVAVVGVTHGHARSLHLRAVVGARESADERGAADEAALTAFCVRANETAKVEVHGRGQGLGYGLAVYRVKSGVWENGR